MIRFWIQESGATSHDWNLIKEVPVGIVNIQTDGTVQSFARVVNFGSLFLPNGANLGVTNQTNDSYQVTAFGLDITGWV